MIDELFLVVKEQNGTFEPKEILSFALLKCPRKAAEYHHAGWEVFKIGTLHKMVKVDVEATWEVLDARNKSAKSAKPDNERGR